jgi:hypothetical protein
MVKVLGEIFSIKDRKLRTQGIRFINTRLRKNIGFSYSRVHKNGFLK